MSPITSIIVITLYFVVTYSITKFAKVDNNSKLGYLLAGRSVPVWSGAMSIAATWIWAPALFVAAQQAYVNGWVGVFWFTVPNVATLIIFGYFATRMRKKYPDGFTFSGYIQEHYRKRTHNLFLLENFGLQGLSMAVQLLAGALVISKITGIDFWIATVVIAAIPFLYTFKKGLGASIITDHWQMIWILIILLLGIPFLFINGGGIESLIAGLSSRTGDIDGLFSGRGLAVTLSFGIPVTIGLLSGTFGDQMFWQRVFAVKEGSVKKVMFLAAGIFALVPLSLSIFGFVAGGSGLDISDTQLTNLSAADAFAPNWFTYLFVVMILSGLISTVDSIICAVSSIAGHDLWRRGITFHLKDELSLAKAAIISVVIFAILVANIPGMQILYLFLFYGTLRASVMLPTAFSILDKNISDRGMFYGILASMVVGLPVFAIGKFSGDLVFIIAGSLLTILLSGILSLSLKENKI
jgi:Na+/proline symporter